jgi:uncharacterized phage protein (TIGR01671 family)
MRTILFRGKLKSAGPKLDGEWVEGLLTSVAERGACIRAFESKNEIPVEQETVGEFAGLLDKCGKRIFEGDILSHTYTGKPYGCRKEREIKIMGKVAFHNEDGGFSIENIVENRMHYHITSVQGWEVIGNVFDNPELTEAQND